MSTTLDLDLAEIARLCRRFHVRHLSVFGSAATREFDASRSDVDFLVEFDDSTESPFDAYFELRDSLQHLLGQPVDLIMSKALENPYFAASVERTRRTVYAA